MNTKPEYTLGSIQDFEIKGPVKADQIHFDELFNYDVKFNFGEIKDGIQNFPSKFVQDVHDFHTKFDFHSGWKPTKLNLVQRHRMIQEEVDELEDALNANDKVGTVDALIDMIYFAVGTLDLLGVDADAHWDAVQKANMKKERGIKASRPDSGGFDCIKPFGWEPPEKEHEALLQKQGFEFETA